MTSRPQSFVLLSEALTGFSRIRLQGTGMTATYFDELTAILPGGMLQSILDDFMAEPTRPVAERAAALLADSETGPVARNIILLWYQGSWHQLPDDWRARHGAAERDTTHVVSAAAYQAGLQWVAAGAHPAGARQQGFGAWSTAPAAPIGAVS